MNIANITIKRPVATVMILLIVVVLGFMALFKIPMDLMPDFDLPYAMVMTTYSNTSPEEVESLVTETIETAMASVENLNAMISYSMEGTSVVMIEFNYDTDMNFATLAMRDKLELVEDYLPDDCSKPTIMKLDMSLMPQAQIFVSAEGKSIAELNGMIEDTIVPRLERAKGVASVSVTGGIDEEIAVKVSQEQLNSYGLSVATLSQILAAENINLPNGSVSKGSSDIIVRTMGKFDSVKDIEEVPLRISDYSIVRLGDIATVTRQQAEQTGIARIDGSTAIGLLISKASDANTVDVSKAMRKALADLEEKYPECNFVIGYDSADYIQASISTLAVNAIYGALLAIIVVFIFLRNIRATLIIGISIPTSLLAALATMRAMDMTLNMITLCALAICVGMLVDNSIVVLENIFRLKQDIASPEEAARAGSKEIMLAIMASTLTTIMVFLPIALSSGLAGMIFADFCKTIIIALLASLIVAVGIVPMLFSKVMRGNVNTTYIRIGRERYKYRFLNKFAGFIESLKEGYGRVLPKALAKPKRFVLMCFGIFIVSMVLIITVGVEILPEADEGMISVSVKMPYGTTLEDKDKTMSKIEEYVLSLPEVEHVAMTTDGLSMLSLSQSSSLTLTLCDKNKRDKTCTELAAEIEDYFDDMTEAQVSAQNSDSMSSYFGEYDLTFSIKGSDFERLEEIGHDLEERLGSMEQVNDAKLDLTEGSPEVQVIIDRNTAAYYGVTTYQLASSLSQAISGKTATRVDIDGEQINLVITLENGAEDVDMMKEVIVAGNYGQNVPVGQIATFKYDNAPNYIYRENQVNTLTLNVDTNSSTMLSGSPEVVAAVEEYPFPEGYYAETGGSYDQMMDAFGDLFLALLAAIALVFLLLAAQFESMLMAFIVMMAVPFAMTGAFLALFLTGTALSLTSFLGLIMLVGIVVNNSILLVEFVNHYKESLGLGEALVQAGKLRLRPILMSATTTIVGMIPISLGFGDGGEMMAPMGISVIGGLAASTLVTLFLIPVIYSMVERRKARRRLRHEAKEEKIAELEAQWAVEDGK